jgi:hypothetical protein
MSFPDGFEIRRAAAFCPSAALPTMPAGGPSIRRRDPSKTARMVNGAVRLKAKANLRTRLLWLPNH